MRPIDRKSILLKFHIFDSRYYDINLPGICRFHYRFIYRRISRSLAIFLFFV